jgi:hypothetical protein
LERVARETAKYSSALRDFRLSLPFLLDHLDVLKMGKIGCPETPRRCHPEERNSDLALSRLLYVVVVGMRKGSR